MASHPANSSMSWSPSLPPDLPLSARQLAQMVTEAVETAQSQAKTKTLEWRGASLDIQSCTLPEWIISGPSETSKTWACLNLLDGLLRQHPGAQAAILRKVHGDLYS